MKAYHVAALFSTFLVLWFLADACAHAVKPDPPQESGTAWTLSPEAKDSDDFCVVIVPSPAMPPEAVGIHCARVGSLRLWMAHLKYAH